MGKKISQLESFDKPREKLKRSGRLLGIELIDHLIFTQEGYFSFEEQGML